MTLLPVLAAAAVYPPSPSGPQVDDFFGTKVADPYRWLEDVDSAETAAWVGGQNKVTFDFLAQLPQREAIKQRLLELYNYPRHDLPFKEGGRYFYTYNTGLLNQPQLLMKDRLEGEAVLLLDPNTLSTDGTVSLTQWDVSPDGRWLGYGVAVAGSDWNEFRVRDVAARTDTADVIKWVKFSGLQWTKDSKGFFYSRYPEPQQAENQVFSALGNQTIYYHRLGTPQSEDVKVFATPDYPQRGWGASVTDDGRYLLIYGSEGTDTRNRLYYVDLQDPLKPDLSGPVVKLIDELEADYNVLGNRGTLLFVRTDLDAPRKKIIAIDLAEPARANWRTLVPEAPDVIETAIMAGGKFVINYLHDAHSRLALFGLDGAPQGEIALPGIGTVAGSGYTRDSGGLTGDLDDPELFFKFVSFIAPATSYRYDLATGRSEPVEVAKVAFDAALYETKQIFYASKDGTRVPMFITHRRGLKLDGSHPTLLYAYGGFDISLKPAYSPSVVAWLELGGVYAQPNLRGGGEYGREWHLAGTKERKQNVFDDFIAAGEWLVANGYTGHDKLVISGGSNGGLLIGAVANQRPDLARVAFPAVGVMDMLRFHKFTIGWAWTSDYGSADDPEGFKYLSAYSPVHNVKAGVQYPAVMVTTADHDDRVHPGHSFKYAAAMQAANPGAKYPTFIRIDVKAGHGQGKPVAKQIEEIADKWAFALHFTGMGAQ
ncbi:Prolyl endopeptidase [Lacunisphaera limnophila]|uniref:prolyl oligopeptidase n=1 Tax=Lacunisphaera limnophila TaxID=1838286 RepID=A0A1D8AXS7_9BACT|nr:prolyl oligopeptidase family serine peptidase [Lacunisphaera limnophila]AOS45680.1 Prolyl endopeptidase [Lacunisphaera limnophila]